MSATFFVSLQLWISELADLPSSGKMVQGLEHIKTFGEVIAILLTVTHGKKKIFLKIENNNAGQHSCLN